VIDQSQPVEEGTRRPWPVLVAAGHVLSFLILFVATAQAADHAGFADQTVALLCAAASVLCVRLYVRVILAARLDASRAATPTHIPLWAIAIYAAIGLALVLMILRSGETYAAIELFVGWAAGCNLLNYLWTRRIRPDTPEALHVVDDWLRAQAAHHRSTSYTLSFLLLFAFVGAHAYESGYAAVAAAQCAPSCAAPVFVHLVAALCGVAAILFVMAYATVTEALQWILVESWRHVRPGPPPPELPSWVIVLHVLIGFVVFFAMAAFGTSSAATQTLGHTYVTLGGRIGGGRHVTLDGRALLDLALG
jgi:hypothetical protein